MNEFEKAFGPIGLGLILLGLPYLLDAWKQLTGWEGRKMLFASIVFTYIPCILLLFASFLILNPDPAIPDYLIFSVGAIFYPLLVWAGVQGIYAMKERRVARFTDK